MTTPVDDPLAPFRAAASPEQRTACLHPPDDRVPLSGDGWLCGLCGADCAPPEALAEELTAEKLDDVDKLARHAHATAFRTGKVLAAAVLALSAEVRRLREREAFLAMCLRAGPPPTSALASVEPPRAGEER